MTTDLIQQLKNLLIEEEEKLFALRYGQRKDDEKNLKAYTDVKRRLSNLFNEIKKS